MAFFDKVGATISNLGNDVSSKIEVSNLNGQLKNCEDSLRLYYSEIGKVYYERNAANPDPELKEKFDKVKEAQEAIDHLKLSICKAKGVKLCSNCGAEVPYDTIFCSSCGAKVDGDNVEVKAEPQVEASVVEPSEPVKCSKCGETLKPGVVFCANCGTKVE